ncbi:MAG: phage baseplate plug family protein [Planctomycetota bacterium]|jgi:hypothetical protein
MATIEIPLRNDIFYYSFTKELDGVVYSLRLQYNRRIDSWILDFIDIVNGIRLAGGQDMLKQFHHLEVPPGRLEIVDLDGKFTEPNKTNIGDRVILQYEEA